MRRLAIAAALLGAACAKKEEGPKAEHGPGEVAATVEQVTAAAFDETSTRSASWSAGLGMSQSSPPPLRPESSGYS